MIWKKLYMPTLRFNRLQWVAHIGSNIPFVILIIDGLLNNLTVNPIQEITQRTGRTAIIWLVLSLTCTPLNIVFGLKPFIQLRRPLGLYAAFYGFLHFLTFSVIDYGLNFKLISQAIIEKPYILLGSLGFLILMALTFTSTKKSMKQLGKKWNILHRFVYLAVILLLIHYLLSLKFIDSFAIFISTTIAILLLIRIPPFKKFFSKRQPSWSSSVSRFLTGRKTQSRKILTKE